MTRVVLSEAEREAIAKGKFVRVAGAWTASSLDAS